MSELRERLREAADAAAREGRTPPAAALVRGGHHRRRRLIGGTAVLVVLVAVAGTLGIDRLTSRQTPLAPAQTTLTPAILTPTTTTVPVPTRANTPLNVEVHVGRFPGPDRVGMVSNVTSLLKRCSGTARILAWAQALGKTWLLAAKPPPPGKNWMCWSDGLLEEKGTGLFAWHGRPSDRLDPLQASQLATTTARVGHSQFSVVSGPVTKQAVRLRILPQKGRPLDLVPFDAGPKFAVNFYAGFFLQPKTTTWIPERLRQDRPPNRGMLGHHPLRRRL